MPHRLIEWTNAHGLGKPSILTGARQRNPRRSSLLQQNTHTHPPPPQPARPSHVPVQRLTPKTATKNSAIGDYRG